MKPWREWHTGQLKSLCRSCEPCFSSVFPPLVAASHSSSSHLRPLFPFSPAVYLLLLSSSLFPLTALHAVHPAIVNMRRLMGASAHSAAFKGSTFSSADNRRTTLTQCSRWPGGEGVAARSHGFLLTEPRLHPQLLLKNQPLAFDPGLARFWQIEWVWGGLFQAVQLPPLHREWLERLQRGNCPVIFTRDPEATLEAIWPLQGWLI